MANMENKKCSFKGHHNIEAVTVCQECKIYMCNNCDNYHSNLLQNLHTFNIKENLKEIFTGLCKEEDHSLNLIFFCKTHNELCCPLCLLTKIKNKNYGQHSNCDVCKIEDIKEEKKQNLNKNIKKLEQLSDDLQNSIIQTQKLYENMKEEKDIFKLKINKIFTQIRKSLKEREDELLLETDAIIESIYFKEKIIKELENMQNITKNNIEKGKKIDNNEWNNENRLNFIINDSIKIENNIENIDKLKGKIKNTDYKIIFMAKNNEINDFLKKIKEFGKINFVENIVKEDFKKIKEDKIKPIILEDNDNDMDKKFKFKFLKDVLEYEEINTKSNFICINDVKIQNIGLETYNDLYFIRDENESSKDFIIAETKEINAQKLTPTGEPFIPGKIENHSIILSIKNPKKGQTYNMYLYVREQKNGINLSKPLKIVYKIKEDEKEKEKEKEEENKINKEEIDLEKVNAIYQELEAVYHLSSNNDKETIIQKIIELKCDRQSLYNWILDEVIPEDDNNFKLLE